MIFRKAALLALIQASTVSCVPGRRRRFLKSDKKTKSPTIHPSEDPTSAPSSFPSYGPTIHPSEDPTEAPSSICEFSLTTGSLEFTPQYCWSGLPQVATFQYLGSDPGGSSKTFIFVYNRDNNTEIYFQGTVAYGEEYTLNKSKMYEKLGEKIRVKIINPITNEIVEDDIDLDCDFKDPYYQLDMFGSSRIISWEVNGKKEQQYHQLRVIAESKMESEVVDVSSSATVQGSPLRTQYSVWTMVTGDSESRTYRHTVIIYVSADPPRPGDIIDMHIAVDVQAKDGMSCSSNITVEESFYPETPAPINVWKPEINAEINV